MPNQYTDLVPEAGLQDKNLWIIAMRAAELVENTGGGSGATGPTYTPTLVSAGASASGSIPAGVTSWSFVLTAGTGTLGGTSVPLNTPISGGALGTPLSYTTGGGSSAFIIYENED